MDSALFKKGFPRIGIVGGGQLGKMLCMEAKKMGLHVNVIDPTPGCPASTVCDTHIVADFKDEDAILELAEKSDFVTFEIELANSKALQELSQKGKKIHPSPQTLYIIQNKRRQKEFLKEKGIPVPAFTPVTDASSLQKAIESAGGRGMLKAAEDSYDGRGNMPVDTQTDTQSAMDTFAGREVFLEKWVDFEKEISVMAARNERGEIATYPVCENIHEESILDTTIVPARIRPETAKEARNLAARTLEHLGGSGVFGIEMFLTQKGSLLVNEIAPRVHNSGHYTIEACKTSQFEQHLRAVLNLPLGSTELLQNAVMVNILGKNQDGEYALRGLGEALAIPGANVHVYGKHESRNRRKMGHVTVLDADLEKAIERARDIKHALIMEGTTQEKQKEE